MKHDNHNHGFTLIEVLIAVLVLSIGLLGLAALQTTALRNNHGGYLRSQATILAYDLIDRMRANRDIALSSNTYLTSINDAPEDVTNCQSSGANCTAIEMGIFDINQWKCSLGKWNDENVCSATFSMKGALPEGDGSVTRDASNVFTVQITYAERAGTINGGTTTLSVRAEL